MGRSCLLGCDLFRAAPPQKGRAMRRFSEGELSRGSPSMSPDESGERRSSERGRAEGAKGSSCRSFFPVDDGGCDGGIPAGREVLLVSGE